MLFANNGILLVALFFAAGVYRNDKWLLVGALVLAGASYVVNMMDELGMSSRRNALFIATIATGVAVMARALMVVGG